MPTDLPPDLPDLARLVVTLPWWRWMPGMRATGNGRDWTGAAVVQSADGSVQLFGVWWGEDQVGPPDLTDPATLGCLRALVSERVGGPVAVYPPYTHDRWCVWAPGQNEEGSGPTEAHALIALGMAT
jgi:hypothetical protein